MRNNRLWSLPWRSGVFVVLWTILISNILLLYAPFVSAASSSSSDYRDAACLRRIKQEWKDAVRMGIAYDWKKQRPVGPRNTTTTLNYVCLGPLHNNLLHWHFSVLGCPNSVYENGIYHGRVVLPRDYPASPPRVQMLTPSGRFVPGVDICLSASNYHPESWTPRWTILALIDALRLHMLTSANEIGGMVRTTPAEKRQLALQSRVWSFRNLVNHALLLTQGALGGLETVEKPTTILPENERILETPTADNTVIRSNRTKQTKLAATDPESSVPRTKPKTTNLASSTLRSKPHRKTTHQQRQQQQQVLQRRRHRRPIYADALLIISQLWASPLRVALLSFAILVWLFS